MREIEARIAELSERRVAAEDQLRRIELRAPIAGIVHELAVHTVGGVIAAGETLMLIVPQDDRLVIEVRIAPGDIDQVKLGQAAVLRFPAFSQRTTPELVGKVVRVAADLTRERDTGQSFYVARLQAEDDSLFQLGQLKLIPGMPAEVFIETGERIALSYLVKPFTDQFARAFKERQARQSRARHCADVRYRAWGTKPSCARSRLLADGGCVIHLGAHIPRLAHELGIWPSRSWTALRLPVRR